MSVMPPAYRIALPQFEGPFDLLLFFIERDEIDIRNIPIARITDDFLGYIKEASALDIALAGEFVVVAATLMSIKARSLIPRLPKDEAGDDVDPRQELVDRLLEYKRYKEVLDDMRTLERERAERFGRGFHADQFAEVIGEAMVEAEWESVTLFKLFKTFERVLQRQRDRAARPIHRVVRWPYTVEEEGTRIRRAVAHRGKVAFARLFGACANRVHAIVTFLALLELLNAGTVTLEPREGEVNGFFVGGARDDADSPEDDLSGADPTDDADPSDDEGASARET